MIAVGSPFQPSQFIQVPNMTSSMFVAPAANPFMAQAPMYGFNPMAQRNSMGMMPPMLPPQSGNGTYDLLPAPMNYQGPPVNYGPDPIFPHNPFPAGMPSLSTFHPQPKPVINLPPKVMSASTLPSSTGSSMVIAPGVSSSFVAAPMTASFVAAPQMTSSFVAAPQIAPQMTSSFVAAPVATSHVMSAPTMTNIPMILTSTKDVMRPSLAASGVFTAPLGGSIVF